MVSIPSGYKPPESIKTVVLQNKNFFFIFFFGGGVRMWFCRRFPVQDIFAAQQVHRNPARVPTARWATVNKPPTEQRRRFCGSIRAAPGGGVCRLAQGAAGEPAWIQQPFSLPPWPRSTQRAALCKPERVWLRWCLGLDAGRARHRSSGHRRRVIWVLPSLCVMENGMCCFVPSVSL